MVQEIVTFVRNGAIPTLQNPEGTHLQFSSLNLFIHYPNNHQKIVNWQRLRLVYVHAWFAVNDTKCAPFSNRII